MCGGYRHHKNVKKGRLKLGSDFRGPFILGFNARTISKSSGLTHFHTKESHPRPLGHNSFLGKRQEIADDKCALESADKPVFRERFLRAQVPGFADGFLNGKRLYKR